MKKEIKDYLESMIDDFNCGNDNFYGKGKKVSFKYEEIEKGDLDNYDEEDVNMFYKVRNYLKEVGEVKVIEGEIEYSFKVVNKKDIKCSFIDIYNEED